MFVFYCPDLQQNTITLSTEDARHCAKALRMHPGDAIRLTDGRGTLADAALVAVTPSDCVADIIERQEVAPRRIRLHLAVAPTKNPDRMEWLVEKAVELGVEQITFVICEHSERRKIDLERMRRIAIAALKQSQTTWLPDLQMVEFNDFIKQQEETAALKYVAW